MRIICILLLGIFVGCKARKHLKVELVEPLFTSGPPTLIYKTKKDYSKLVPVILSDDKTEIVSFPHPNDLKKGNFLSVPTALNTNYYLDNRGIGLNVAFLKYTYKEYSELDSVPNAKELFSFIVDKDPLTKLCDCGNRNTFTDVVPQLNLLITKNELRKRCKVLK